MNMIDCDKNIKNLKIAVSSCPNDTFIFGGLLNGFVESDYRFFYWLGDVQQLNNMALNSEADIIKVSYGVLPHISDNYKVLKAGGALGFGCGPLLLSKQKMKVANLYRKKIAIPGFNTSAFYIFNELFGKHLEVEYIEYRFDNIMDAIASDKVAAGLVIHEGRFLYKEQALHCILDLGDELEKRYGGSTPIPLGAIVIRKQLAHMADDINRLINTSIDFAYDNYEKIELFIKSNAQYLSEDVIRKHIKLYVNDYSKDVSSKFSTAVEIFQLPDDMLI